MSDPIAASNTSSPHSGSLIESFREDTPEIGADVFIHPSAAIIGRVCLGDRVSIWPQVTLRGDEGEIRVGADTNIQDGTTIHMTGGYSETMIGARVTVGHMCLLHGCKIGDDCLIGMGTMLLDRCEIGEGSYIAAGTMITGGKVIPPKSFVMGRPGSLTIKPISEIRTQERAYSWRHYVSLAQEYLKRSTARGVSTVVMLVTLSLMSSSLNGCAVTERPYEEPRGLIHQHHISFATLKQQNLYDYSLFANTELDLFSHRREIITLTQRQPLTINYRSFSSPRVDYLIERAQSLYAQYRFAANAIERFRSELTDIYGTKILDMSFDELQILFNREGDPERSEAEEEAAQGADESTDTQTPPTKADQPSELERSSTDESPGTPSDQAEDAQASPTPDQETSEPRSPKVNARLAQRAKAARLAIAGHQDLVARAVRAQLDLDDWEEAADADLKLNLNLINVRSEMARDIDQARQSLDALMSGAPLLSKSMSEVSAAAAAIR